MIKLIVFDFDGVFTNGNIYFTSTGKTMKYYHARDSMGIQLLRKNGYHIGLLSGNNSKATYYIAKHIGFKRIAIACQNKLAVLRAWTRELGLHEDEVAYIGDDLIDLEVIQSVGFSACPADAIAEVKTAVKYVCQNRGGKGAVREFCEYLISKRFCDLDQV